jgi:hypothetical protein
MGAIEMKRASWLVVGVSVAIWSPSARADGPAPVSKAACLDASNQAQTFRDAHKLLEARAQLRICAQQGCPSVVQKDCLTWIDSVEASLPTVVVTAKDGAGRDLVDVKVTADGQPLTTKLVGDAIPMNPGAHSLHFETADGATLDQQIVVREGIKNQSVAVVLGKAAPAALAAPGTAAPVPAGAPPAPVDTPPADTTSSSTWRTVGWVVGGVGIVGLGVGTVFGFMAMSDKSSADCNAAGVCLTGQLNSANSAATVSTVGLIAGGVLLAGGAALVLFAPRGDAAAGASLKLAPLVGSRDGGVVLGGSW